LGGRDDRRRSGFGAAPWNQIVYEERPSARAVVVEFPAAVDEVFNRAFAKDSQDRRQTCTEFVPALKTAFAAPELRAQQLYSRCWLWVAGAVLAFLLMAWFAERPGRIRSLRFCIVVLGSST
jgi:hypothetical protein